MHNALMCADIVICILSNAYQKSANCTDEWTNAEKIIPIRFDNCKPPGPLKSRVYIDLNGMSKDSARTRLVEQLTGNVRPADEPDAPFSTMKSEAEPSFPGFSDDAQKASSSVPVQNNDMGEPKIDEHSGPGNIFARSRLNEIISVIASGITIIAFFSGRNLPDWFAKNVTLNFGWVWIVICIMFFVVGLVAILRGNTKEKNDNKLFVIISWIFTVICAAVMVVNIPYIVGPNNPGETSKPSSTPTPTVSTTITDNPPPDRDAPSSTEVGYYTDWTYSGTEGPTRSCLSGNGITTRYVEISSYRVPSMSGGEIETMYTYSVFKRLYIGSDHTEFKYVEPVDESDYAADQWIYAGSVKVMDEVLFSDENTRYTFKSSDEVAVDNPIDGTFLYKTQRIYDIVIREDSIEKLSCDDSVNDSGLSGTLKATAGYYTKWVYTGTETSRNLLSDNMLTQYKFQKRETMEESDGNTVYYVYTYAVYKRLYIGSDTSEFDYVESSPDEPVHDTGVWVYAGAVTVVNEWLFSDETIKYTLRSEVDVPSVINQENGTFSYNTQRVYDVAVREDNIIKLTRDEAN